MQSDSLYKRLSRIAARSFSRRACTILVVTVLGASVLVAGVSVPQPAQAADASQFNPGNIISNETFYNSSTMSAAEIQSFITSKVTGCTAANGQPCLKDYRATTPTIAATEFCGTYGGLTNESAAQIIQRVGAACSINPQVLLVVLEKETSLVSAKAPTALTYRKAMGYGCPDTAECDSTYYGFFNQVYNAASQYQRYTKTASSWRYKAGQYNTVQWHPNAACGSTSVYIQNQATANLYIYTPYQPNAAAMSNMYGTGDGCSSYGNRNFWRIFSDWFGSPTEGNLVSPSFEGGTARGWGASNGYVNQLVAYGPSQAQNGNFFLATNTAVAGRAMSQDVKRNISVGEQVTAKVWVRAASSTPFTGVLALWGLGGQTEGARVPFTATQTWQEVVVKMPIRTSAHSTIRLDLYMDSTDGTLWVDNASLEFGVAPPVQNSLGQPSFEGSFGAWAPGFGFMNQQIYQDPALAKHNSWFAATNTPVAGRSLAQELPVKGVQNDRYTFSIWVRAADPNKPFPGTLALWGFGGSGDIVNPTNFTATGEWQRVTTTLDVSVPSIVGLKAEVYLGSNTGTLWMDDGLVGKNLLTAGSFENGSFANWGTGNGTTNQAVYSSDSSIKTPNGSYFAAANTADSGSLAQTIPRVTTVGDRYTAEIWVRSGDTSKTFNGTLALWALGGTTEVGSVPFVANGTWQKVQLLLPVNTAHTQLKFEVYLQSTGNTLFVDGAQVY